MRDGAALHRAVLRARIVPDWSRRFLDGVDGPVPVYGSQEWHALPADDPRRVAAVVAAAEAHRYASHPAVLEANARVEIAASVKWWNERWAEDEEEGWTSIAAMVPADLLRPRPAEFADAVPVVQDPEGLWPEVTVPGARPVAEPAPTPEPEPRTVGMLRRLRRHVA